MVFHLPLVAAAITTVLATESRSRVTDHSRTSTRIVTHHQTSPMIESATSAIPVSALSAMGSAILPKSVTRLRARAMSPSILSVAIATTKTPKAAERQPIESWSWPSSIQP